VKYYHLTVWAQGQVKWAKMAKSPPIMRSLTKNPQPTKNFFQVPTRRLAAFLGFWTVFCHFGARVTHAQSHVLSGCFGVRILIPTRRQSVNMETGH